MQIRKKLFLIIFLIKNLFLTYFRKGLSISSDVQIRKTQIRKGKISISRGCRIGMYVIIDPSNGFINIGEYTSIHDFSVISGMGGVSIGKYVAIASQCAIIASNHVYINPEEYIKRQGNTAKGIVIEDDVWLGIGVKVLDGVTIGKGSIIGAGSIVTKSIPSYSIAVGIPAKVIKNRK
ncbi:MAG: acyltransferase [Clostridia bacterium]|nr:acyltransferase [Clostridia bacterium]MDD4386491.1 acyltransferase [Clostridia bacterium]